VKPIFNGFMEILFDKKNKTSLDLRLDHFLFTFTKYTGKDRRRGARMRDTLERNFTCDT